jgi:hypothetical protein
MFSERLENLIKAALQDGVLTDQEKASIIKRAQAEGEDIDEVEIYIQSLMQKRQQELNQKNKEERDILNDAIAQEEKERSKMLRKCPKCGVEIPHLTSVCPECGFIIDKSSKDEKIVLLKSILREYINGGTHYWGRELRYVPPIRKEISKEQFEMLSNCFESSETKENGLISARCNLQGVTEEASLYRNNDEINSLLNQLAKKEARAYYDVALERLKKTNDEAINEAKTILSVLQNRYADNANNEIVSLEGKILEVEAYKNSPKGKLARYMKHLWWIIPLLLILKFCSN